MIDTIKKASVTAVGAGNPVEMRYGEVANVEPLEIKIENQKDILPKQFFVITESLTRYEIDLSHAHNTEFGPTTSALGKIVIREGLKKGDKVLLLRMQGGQKYIIYDRVV